MKHEFRIYQRCPIPKNIAPYIVVCCQDALPGNRFAVLLSAYRGADAEPLLNKYGKSSQRQLYNDWLRGEGAPANKPGSSTHEQKLGGAYPGPRTRDGAWWQLGFDIDDEHSDSDLVIHAARSHGWVLFRPYPGGSEHHHLNFKTEPKPHSLRMKARVIQIRTFLPRS